MDTWPGRDAFEDVLARARRGDEAAFVRLWRWLQPPLVRWLGVVAPGAGDDVASEVWLSVIRGLEVFEGDERAFRSWLFTIARRRAIDWARQRRRLPVVVELDDLALRVDVVDEESGELPVETALVLLRSLNPDQAEVIALRVIGGLTVAETAAVVGKSPGAVRVLCHRGLRALAREIGDETRVTG